MSELIQFSRLSRESEGSGLKTKTFEKKIEFDKKNFRTTHAWPR